MDSPNFDVWKSTFKIDITLLALNSIMLGANIHEQDWLWVTLFSASVTFFAAKLVCDIDVLVDLGEAGINLANTIEEKVKQNEQKP